MKDVVPELVGHRLAMGFQLVTQNKRENPAQSIMRYPADSIKKSYKLSLGRTYHELFYIVDKQTGLDFVKVEISVPKRELNSKINEKRYLYRFQVPDSRLYHISYCEIARKDIKQTKWNIIDRYICIQGNGSISPLELQNCWRQRLYLLPLMYPSTQMQNSNTSAITGTHVLTEALKNMNMNSSGNTSLSSSPSSSSSLSTSSSTPVQSVRFDIFQRKTLDELRSYREVHFLRFMEYLNKLTRADDRRINLTITQKQIANTSIKPLPSPKEKLDQLLSEYEQLKIKIFTLNSLLNDSNNSSLISTNNNNQNIVAATVNDIEYNNCEKFLKQKRDEIHAYLGSKYKQNMLTGVPFLMYRYDIPPNCFVSAECTWWCIQNINDIDNEAQAIKFLQILLDFDIIQHISKYEKTYMHGFYLYYILTKESLNTKFEYTKDYCEVGLCEFDCGTTFESKNLIFSKKLPKQQQLLPVAGTDYSYSQYGLNSTLESPIHKIVNVDVDPNSKSTRVEWASAIYRSYHHPLTAFELELYWKMATGQLLAELVNNWAKKSLYYNYHLVPSPIDPFAPPTDQLADPLRGYIYIPLNISCLLQDENILFENYIEKQYFEFDKQAKNRLNLKIENLDELDNDSFKEFLSIKYKNNSNHRCDSPIQNNFQRLEDFQEFLERERILRLQYLQEAILEKFGFIRNAAITKQHNSDEDSTFFIHCSGGIFVCLFLCLLNKLILYINICF